MRPGLRVLFQPSCPNRHPRLIRPTPPPCPTILPPVVDQPFPDRILKNILNLRIQPLRAPQNMIKRLLLPNRPVPSHLLINPPSGGALNTAHDVDERKYLTPTLIDQWSQNHVNMIGHHHRDVQLVLPAMIMAAAGKYNIASPIRQYTTELRHKRDEMRLEIHLQVRQIAAVELHTKFCHTGTTGESRRHS